MLASNAMQDLMTSAMSSMPRLDSHSCSKAKLGCMYACMFRSERNLGLASKAEKGWITARYSCTPWRASESAERQSWAGSAICTGACFGCNHKTGLNPSSAKHWTCPRASVVLGAAWVHLRCNQARGCAMRTQLHARCNAGS